MCKIVLVPLLSLESGQSDSFLELSIEPGGNKHTDCFRDVAEGPLKQAVNSARQALRMLPAGHYPSTLSLVATGLTLSTSGGASLALTLAPLLLHPEFPYRRYIITGTLEFSDHPELPIKVGDSGNLLEKLRAVCQLGYQSEPTLLIMPRHEFDIVTIRTIYRDLAQNNVAVRNVGTLQEAYEVCYGRLCVQYGSSSAVPEHSIESSVMPDVKQNVLSLTRQFATFWRKAAAVPKERWEEWLRTVKNTFVLNTISSTVPIDVRIPIIDTEGSLQDDEEARLWKVLCSPADVKDTEKIRDKARNPVIDALRGSDSHSSAERAYAAVLHLLAPKYNHTFKVASDDKPLKQKPRSIKSILYEYEFTIADGDSWVKNIQGNSSDVGLALCLLMNAAPTQTRAVAATGWLGDTQDSDQWDTVVKPVAGMAKKLHLMIEQKRNNKLPESLTKIITPQQHICWQGKERFPMLELVKLLPEAQELEKDEKLNLTICPVTTLGEAAQVLGIDIHINWWHRWIKPAKYCARWLLPGMTFVLLVAAGLIGYAMTRPVYLHWEAPQKHQTAEPYLVCQNIFDKSLHFAAIPRAALQIPVVPADAELGWVVRLGPLEEGHTWTYRLARDWFGYRGLNLAMVMIGQKTGIAEEDHSVELPLEAERRFPLGRAWSSGWQLDGTTEKMLLVVLAKRWGSFDIGGLKRDLQQRFGKQSGDINFTAVEQYLAEQADGSVHFIFETRMGEGSGCDKINNKS